MATIRQPLDFYGVNYYTPFRIGAAGEEAPMPFEFREVVGYPTTDLHWSVVPDALREWLIMFRARLRAAVPPIYITESGCAYNMGPDEDGVVDDQPRIDYHAAHLTAVAEAVRMGVDVRGYYAWSLMDNFEWARRLHAAVRAGARRLRDAAAHQEAVVPVVRRPRRGHAQQQRLGRRSRKSPATVTRPAPCPSGARSR